MEAKLTKLVERLKAAAGENLQAVVLYGSAVTGEFQSKHSDLNILCIVGRAASSELEALHPATAWWVGERNRAPLVFTLDELRRSADIYAIELFDIKQKHRMLYGEDFFATFEVPLHFHRLQVERELRANWLRLREAILTAPQKRKVHLALMLSTISTFCVLFRHALGALGQPMPETKRQAVDAVSALVGADPSGFRAILDFREGKRRERQIDVEASLHAYLELVELVTNEYDRRLEAMNR